MPPITITEFTGQAENPHIGAGVAVGVDLYTTKNVARLSRKMVKKSGSVVTDMPFYIAQDNVGNLYVQDESNRIYKSADEGDTWSALSPQPTGSFGAGLMIWEDYLFAATATTINVYGPLSGGAAWINGWWTSGTGANQTALVNDSHMMYINPALNFLYICNNRYIAYVQLATPTSAFNPASSATFLASDKAFIMPAYYRSQTMGFLPPNHTAIAVENKLNKSKADIVIWDGLTNTTASNVISVPGATGAVRQLITQNGVLYGVTNYEHGIYTINGSSAKLVDRLALRMSNRTSGGAQNTRRLSSYIYPMGIDFLGPELLTGGGNTFQPVTQASNTGLYPYGVWSVNIENSVINVRFPLSHGDINAQYTTTYEIGFIKVLSAGKVIVGWGKGATYGIDALNASDYISNAATVFVESSLYEVGTRTLPRTFEELEYNLIQPLLAGETFTWYWRNALSNDYQSFHVENLASLGSALSDLITPLPFGSVQYIQVAFSMNSDSATPTNTPQVRSMTLRSN